MAANAAAALKALNNTRKNLGALNAQVKNTLEKSGVVKAEANATIKKMEEAENLIRKARNETRRKTVEAQKERKRQYEHKLEAFMKARDPSKRYTQTENNALRNRAGHAVYGRQATYWNSKTHRATEWNRMQDGGRRRRRGRKASRKAQKKRRMTRRR